MFLIITILFEQLVGDYLRDTYWTRIGISSRDSRELNTVAARLLLDLMPGLETSVVFHDTEGLINRLFQWAERGPDPLQTYATGLLAAAMELQDLAANYREQNGHLAPLMLKRLWDIQKKCAEDRANTENNHVRRFSNFLPEPATTSSKPSKPTTSTKTKGWTVTTIKPNSGEDAELMPGPSSGDSMSEKIKASKNRLKKNQNKLKNNKERKVGNSSLNGSLLNDSSNSSWAEMESFVIGNTFNYLLKTLT